MNDERIRSDRICLCTEFFLRVAFSYAVGNADMHLKNFSLIETSPGSQSYILSPAYDMLPTNLVLPEDTEQMALTLNGKKSNLRKDDFMVFAETIDLPRKAAEKMIEKISSMQPVYVSMCLKSYLPESMKTSMEKLLKGRMFKSHN